MSILFDQLRDFAYIYRYDDSGVSWSANLKDSAALDYFDDDAAVGDYILFGYAMYSGYPFHDLRFNVGTQLVADSITVAWEYRNSSNSWAAIPGVTDNTNAFQNAGVNSVTFTVPTNWGGSSVHGVQGYLVRCRLTAISNITEGGAQQTDKVQAKDWAIEVVGYSAVTPCYAVDIWNADQAGGWGVFTRDGDKLYHCESNLFIGDGSTASYSTVKNVAAVVLESRLIVKANAVFDLGVLEDAVNKTTSGGVYFYYTKKYANAYIGHSLGSDGEFNVYGSCVIGDYSEAGFTRVINSNLDGCWKMKPQSASAEFDRVNIGTLASGKAAIWPDVSASFNDIYFYEYKYALRAWAANKTTTVSNFKGRNNTYIWFVQGPNGKNETLNLINADTDTWSIYWNATYYTATYLNRQYTVDINVLDGNNNGIEGAAVTLKDKNGVEQFSLTTDVNGEITQQTVTSHQYSWASGSKPGVTTDTDYSPFTLSIQKSGYQAYSEQFTLDEKIDWRIALLTPVAKALTSRTEREISFTSPKRELSFASPKRNLVFTAPKREPVFTSPKREAAFTASGREL